MSVSRKLACGLLAAGAPLATAGALALASGTASASNGAGLPVLTLHMNGSSIAVAGQKVSGAVDVRSVVTSEKSGQVLLIRVNPGVSYAKVAKTLQGTNDLNAVQLVGAIAFDASVPQGKTDIQTVLKPDRYVALDVAGKGAPRIAKFVVKKSASPAKLPAASATSRAIEFGFRGPSTLKDNTMVRGVNKGWLVHMDEMTGVKGAKAGRKLIALFKAGKTSRKQAAPYLNGAFYEIYSPVSHGAVQQRVMSTKPGYYVEACFMNTQDGREHTQLGMVRLVHVVK